jgi:hypothetical protein
MTYMPARGPWFDTRKPHLVTRVVRHNFITSEGEIPVQCLTTEPRPDDTKRTSRYRTRQLLASIWLPEYGRAVCPTLLARKMTDGDCPLPSCVSFQLIIMRPIFFKFSQRHRAHESRPTDR